MLLSGLYAARTDHLSLTVYTEQSDEENPGACGRGPTKSAVKF